jgi:predicted permease
MQLPSGNGALSLDVALDWRVLAFSASVALVALMLLAAAPALYATRVPPIEVLRHAGRGSVGHSTMSSSLVVCQIALSVVLLSAAGLFARTLDRLVNVSLGFAPEGIVVATVNSARSVLEPSDPRTMYQRALDAVTATQGVSHVAASVWAPIGTGGGNLLTDARGRRSDVSRQVAFNFVTPGWFDTYRIAIQRGRDFLDRDAPGAPRVAIINESLRRTLLGDVDPIGHTIHAGPCSETGCAVVGVVADTVYGQSLRDAAPPIVFVPLAQSAALAPPNAPFRLSLRSTADLAQTIRAVGAALRGVDSALTFTFRRVDQDLHAAVAQERLLAALAGFFGVVALLLSAVGLYGVTAYASARRRVEIGIRLALGGEPRSILRSMLRHTTLLVVVGTAIGTFAALWLGRFVTPLLYGIEPHDAATFAVAILMLALVAIVAAGVPASRATRVDPAQVLRDH